MQLLDYLYKAVRDEASDLFIVAGGPVYEKQKNKELVSLGEKLSYKETEELITQIYAQARRPMEHFQAGDDDFSFAIGNRGQDRGSRFRVNTYRQRGSMAAVVRVVAFGIPNWQEKHIPSEVMDLADLTDGMLLVTGTAGSGKSTTQACIIDRINRSRSGHIITLEDPIEYLHKSRPTDAEREANPARTEKGIVSQREIAIDTEDYLSALRACMRQAPDVILLGEMRDRETIQTAMTAAETGHLVIATLHTKGAANAVDRIVDSFPAGQQEQIRIQLSMVLRAVVSQQLLPCKNREEGVVPAFEIMQVTSNIRNLIRKNKSHQIDNAIATSYKAEKKEEKMISMNQYMLDLCRAGQISRKTAEDYSDNSEQMRRLLDGSGVT